MPGCDARRLEELFELEHRFVEKLLRRFGVPERDIDDATQQVFIVVAEKLGTLVPGVEKGFIFRTAMHVASHVRRKSARRREELREVPEEVIAETPSPEGMLAERRAQRVLALALSRLDSGAREVFVRHDLGNQTQLEIATTLALPPGTVASRLRRARRSILSEVRRGRLYG